MTKFRTTLVSAILVGVLIASAVFAGGGCGKKAEQILRVNLMGNPVTLDPQIASEARDATIIMQVFNGLLGFNQDLTLKPVVAEEVPSVDDGGISQNGTVYIFKLRHDVTWSDGENVTANDFVYSIRRLLDPNTVAPYSGYFMCILNAPEYQAGNVSADQVGVKALDNYTLQITLSSPCYSFLERMTLCAVYPIRQDIVEANDKWAESHETYIGDGPFELKEWVANDHVTLERNPNYWGTPAKLDEVRYSMYGDASTEYLAYQAGDLDITNIPIGMERTLAGSTELLSYPRLKTNALFFDCGEAPFNNTVLRQAFALAINRTALAEDVRGGRGSVTYCWIPAGMPGYNTSYQQTTGSQWACNATEAKELLAQAGYPNGIGLPPITLVYSNSGSNPIIAQFIQGQLSTNLGVNIETVGIEQTVYFDRVFSEHNKWDLAYLSFSADYMDPDNWLPDFFTTNGGYSGIAQYSNTAFDNKVDEALAQSNDTQRLALWKDAEAIMVQDAPAIFLFDDKMLVLKKDNVKGIVGTAMDVYVPGDLFMANIYRD